MRDRRVMDQWIPGRGEGDRVLTELTDALAEATREPRAILMAAAGALNRLRPGIWVASLMTKDPSVMRVITVDDGDPDTARYVQAFEHSGHLSDSPISSRVIETGEPLLLPSISIVELADRYLDEGARGYMQANPWPASVTHFGIVVVPMRARGATIGTLGLFEPGGSAPLTPRDMTWLQRVAERTAAAVENAQLYEDATKRLERLDALQSIGLAITSTEDLALTLKIILDRLVAHLEVDSAHVLLLDQAENVLSPAASAGFRATAAPDYRVPLDEELVSQAIANPGMETLPRSAAYAHSRRRTLFARERFIAYGALPITAHGNQVGVLEVFHRAAISPDQEWWSFLEALAGMAAIAIDGAAMREGLQRGSTTRRGGTKAPDLSPAELRILVLLVQGLTNREISAQVHLSPSTVKFHVRQILTKTGAANRTDLTRLATREGWV